MYIFLLCFYHFIPRPLKRDLFLKRSTAEQAEINFCAALLCPALPLQSWQLGNVDHFPTLGLFRYHISDERLTGVDPVVHVGQTLSPSALI